MKLYIEVRDGEPINHPTYEEHVLAMFGGVIPENWQPFVRPPRPEKIDKHQYISPHAVRYEKNSDGVWTDVYEIRPMTDEERYAYDLQQSHQEKLNMMRNRAEGLKIHRLKNLVELMQTADIDPDYFNLLRIVYDAHAFHVFKSYDPVDPPFMKFPKKDENGKWYIPQ